MKNITHLEDLAITEDVATVLEIVSALLHTIIQGNKNKVLSIKYDGAPLVVFGREDKTFFVSNKSYFNKDPIRYTTMDEIEDARVHEDVKDKLAAVYHEYADASIPDDMVYFADYLFSNYWHPRDETPPVTNTFRPNIIQYELVRGNLEQYQLGLAFHARRFCGQDQELHFPFNPHVWNPPIYPDIENDFESFIAFDWLWQLEADDKDYDVKEMRRHLNHLAREYPHHTQSNLLFYKDIDPNLFLNLDILINIKYLVLEHLNRGTHGNKTFKMTINGHQTHHEGYVFKYNDRLIKLVDRYAFSKANFDKSTERGWTRNTAN